MDMRELMGHFYRAISRFTRAKGWLKFCANTINTDGPTVCICF